MSAGRQWSVLGEGWQATVTAETREEAMTLGEKNAASHVEDPKALDAIPIASQ